MEFLLPIQVIADRAPVFLLVLFRIAGIMVFAPLLGAAAIPITIKVLIVLVLSAAVFPLLDISALSIEMMVPKSYITLAIGVAREMLIGLVMGFTLMLMFIGVQVGAELISQQMALSLAQISDPLSNSNTDILTKFYLMLATLIYVLMNGHLILIGTLVQTFESIPLLTATFDRGMLDTMLAILNASFMLGIRFAGPAVAAIFLATIALGFISRTMPQLNILAAGFPIRILLALILLIASLGTVCGLFQDSIVNVLSGLGQLFI
jgi:flagellar biosynthetic protein FliR